MNPYRLLNISPDAAPREIIRAAASALRENKHSARDIAEARKQLMNPETRRVLDFIHTVDLAPLLSDAGKDLESLAGAGEPEGGDIAHMERLDIFDQQR